MDEVYPPLVCNTIVPKALAGPSSEKKVFPTYDPISVFILLPACFLNTLAHSTVLDLR